jgi:voltage-gated potassium channel
VPTWRSTIADCLVERTRVPPGRRVVTGLLLAAVTASVLVVILETVPGQHALHVALFAGIQYTALALFTVEYALRVWIAPECDPRGRPSPWTARWHYMRSPAGVVDALAVVPSYVYLAIPMDPDWLRVLRLLAVLKVARYAPGLSLFVAVVRNERRALMGGLLVMLVILVMSSGVMFALEQDAQPKAFASIPDAMWWALVTLTTVGFGDVTPITPLGKLVGGVVMILGFAMFAVPAGILASGFAAEIRKRDFVVTWEAVAAVPLFATLDAGRIAQIAAMLKRQVVPAQHVIVRRGGPGDAMVFIMTGEVEVDVDPRPLRLGAGQYFGEIALLRDSVRTATVTSLSECQLLVLEVADFRRLLKLHPDLEAAIMAVAERRLSASGDDHEPPPTVEAVRRRGFRRPRTRAPGTSV